MGDDVCLGDDADRNSIVADDDQIGVRLCHHLGHVLDDGTDVDDREPLACLGQNVLDKHLQPPKAWLHLANISSDTGSLQNRRRVTFRAHRWNQRSFGMSDHALLKPNASTYISAES